MIHAKLEIVVSTVNSFSGNEWFPLNGSTEQIDQLHIGTVNVIYTGML